MSQSTANECFLKSARMSCGLDPIHSKLWIECLHSTSPLTLFISTILLHLASSQNASNQHLSHLFSKIIVLKTMIWTTIRRSPIYAMLQIYLKNVPYPTFVPTSTHTIYAIHFNQHIVLVTALKQLFWMLLVICSIRLNKASCLY